ncbi:TetR family transcriptional regulator [Nocardia rosealba]|uniref:TetR/AcrR family transcriptional regulator n=1 Tax=Nocardia TaxID=1817 RepID=UPI001CD9A5B3|nr:TetR family transcriptional regulator [Nocardia rosealba]MCA2207986.1 TetR/AcrR family transcriptional regulator [Nocardia rosealba]
MSENHSDPAILEATRRRLTEKQADTVDRLTRAAVDVITEQGYSGLTVRQVAAAAGVGTATAYTYFSSKEHLVAEVFWRRLLQTPQLDHDDDKSAAERVVETLRQVSLMVGGENELAGAVTSALLGQDPDVSHLRVRIGLEIRQRIARALGPDHDPDVLEAFELLYAGALVRAGMGYGTYDEMADRIEKSVYLILE